MLGTHRISKVSACLLVLTYAVVFSRSVPTGDSYRNAGRIAEDSLQLDPNHLFLEPVLLFASRLQAWLGSAQPPFMSFRVLSAIAAATSVWLFFRWLEVAGIRSTRTVFLATAGLVASNAFLTLTVSEEPFLLQLPFIILALTSISTWLVRDKKPRIGPRSPTFMAGVWMAIACLISIHNIVFAVMLSGFVACCAARGSRVSGFISYAAGGILVGVPTLVTAHFFAAPDTGLMTWLTTYQGAASQLDTSVYAPPTGPREFVMSAARVLAAISGAFVADGGLAALAKRTFFGAGENFTVNYATAAWGGVAVLLFTTFMAIALMRLFTGRQNRHALFLLCIATLAYVAFGMVWNGKAHQFWVPLVPVTWMFVASTIGPPGETQPSSSTRHIVVGDGFKALWLATTLVLVTTNTLISVRPAAVFDAQSARESYRKFVKSADVLIVPGWDDYGWTLEVHREIDATVYHLYEMALEGHGEPPLATLTDIVARSVSNDDTVLVTRLFDQDSGQNPWTLLEIAGWPRQRIVDLLSAYCNTRIGEVEGIVIRRIKPCERTTDETHVYSASDTATQ